MMLIWYDMTRYDLIWYDMIRFDMISIIVLYTIWCSIPCRVRHFLLDSRRGLLSSTRPGRSWACSWILRTTRRRSLAKRSMGSVVTWWPQRWSTVRCTCWIELSLLCLLILFWRGIFKNHLVFYFLGGGVEWTNNWLGRHVEWSKVDRWISRLRSTKITTDSNIREEWRVTIKNDRVGGT